MRKLVYVLFWLYRSKENQKGTTPIYCRITVDSRKVELATGYRIEPTRWDEKKCRIKGMSDEAQITNSALDKMKVSILEAKEKLEKGNKVVSSQALKAIVSGKDSVDKTVNDSFQRFISRTKVLIGKGYTKSTVDKFKYTFKNVSSFLVDVQHRSDFSLADLNLQFIKDFEHYLKVNSGHKPNTVHKTLQRLKQVVKEAVDNGWLDKDPFKGFKNKATKSEIVYLTTEEVSLIENTDFKSDKLQIAADVFIFCCYSGLAYHEVANLKKDNKVKGMDGGDWIEAKRLKTGKSFKVPLLPKAKEILDKYEEHPFAVNKGILLPVYSNQKLNDNLKLVAAQCGISKNLTTHIARKTFATIGLENGLSIDVIASVLGHSTQKITEDFYAVTTEKKISKEFRKLR